LLQYKQYARKLFLELFINKFILIRRYSCLKPSFKRSFKNTTPKALYELYMDAKKHSTATGAAAKISGKVGGSFSARNGYITGKNLQLVKNKLIVQTWRAQDWNKDDLDSTFIIALQPKGNDVVLQVVHANVPDEQAKEIDKGWYEFY